MKVKSCFCPLSWNLQASRSPSTSKMLFYLLNSTCRRSGCLEIPTRAAAPTTTKGQAGKGKYTELI